ncbi:hypothetical protein KCP69_26755 (plasmid) [Salmonella enterica subsp. enterica]|nr:hypothetical protein KCP69_26755 [Salmonella enterica subsp. enterica]
MKNGLRSNVAAALWITQAIAGRWKRRHGIVAGRINPVILTLPFQACLMGVRLLDAPNGPKA